MITRKELQEMCVYDATSGELRWKYTRNSRALKGKRVGCLDKHGYLVTLIGKKNYLVHRLVWLFIYGRLPKIVDHINGIKDDNRLSNLRSCTVQQSAKNKGIFANNKTGYKGVSICTRSQRYQVTCRVNGIKKWLGYFDDVLLAAAAYQAYAKQQHAEFYRPPKEYFESN